MRQLRPMSSFRCLAILAGVLVLGISLLPAQTASAVTTIYRLDKTSTFQRGCFPPCLCPVMESGSERGTFVLSFDGSDGLFDHYRVDEVNWTVTLPSGEVKVTGAGTYKVGGEFAVQHQLELDLKVGDNPVEHFDSGLVAGGGDFPRISISISIHGQYCFDTVIGIDAAPVPADQVSPYRLQEQSTFQRGCSGPCACAPGSQLPLRGTFFLVLLEQDPLFTEFSVVQANWLAGSNSSSLPVTGFGTYRVGGEFAIEQRMSLDLKVGSEDPARFDSGLVPGGGSFPRIDIQITNGGANCVTTLIDLHAKAARFRSARLSVPGEPLP